MCRTAPCPKQGARRPKASAVLKLKIPTPEVTSSWQRTSYTNPQECEQSNSEWWAFFLRKTEPSSAMGHWLANRRRDEKGSSHQTGTRFGSHTLQTNCTRSNLRPLGTPDCGRAVAEQQGTTENMRKWTTASRLHKKAHSTSLRPRSEQQGPALRTAWPRSRAQSPPLPCPG